MQGPHVDATIIKKNSFWVLFRSWAKQLFFMIKSNCFDKDFGNNGNKLHLNTNEKLWILL